MIWPPGGSNDAELCAGPAKVFCEAFADLGRQDSDSRTLKEAPRGSTAPRSCQCIPRASSVFNQERKVKIPGVNLAFLEIEIAPGPNDDFLGDKQPLEMLLKVPGST